MKESVNWPNTAGTGRIRSLFHCQVDHFVSLWRINNFSEAHVDFVFGVFLFRLSKLESTISHFFLFCLFDRFSYKGKHSGARERGWWPAVTKLVPDENGRFGEKWESTCRKSWWVARILRFLSLQKKVFIIWTRKLTRKDLQSTNSVTKLRKSGSSGWISMVLR